MNLCKIGLHKWDSKFCCNGRGTVNSMFSAREYEIDVLVYIETCKKCPKKRVKMIDPLGFACTKIMDYDMFMHWKGPKV